MADIITPETIVARCDDQAGQWLGHFEHFPQVAFGGDMPVEAIRRLLEEIEAIPDTYLLRCDSDQTRSRILHKSLIWDPPKMLFECLACRGTGQYVGLTEVETCQTCGGRKVVTA